MLQTKTCTKCGSEKDATVEFWNVHKLGKFGLNPACKDCRKKSEAARRANGLVAQKQAAWRASHKKEMREYMAVWLISNAGRKRVADAAYHASHRQQANTGRSERYMKDRVGHYFKAREWVKKNPDLARKYAREWAHRNKEKVLARCRFRQAAKMARTPQWLTLQQVREMAGFYRASKNASERSGVAHHVDHIIPIHWKKVSGLHVPWNLRVIPASENMSKGNRIVQNETGGVAAGRGVQ